MLCIRIPTYQLLTYLDYVAYGCLHPHFDLVAERGCPRQPRLQLSANTPQRYRVVTIRDATTLTLTLTFHPALPYHAGYQPWPYPWPYSSLSFA